MTQPNAKIICHSVNPWDEGLITMEIEGHRFILPEINTHRTFSRNFQSSRAIPIERMIKMVRDNPAMPVFWGKNQAGMQAYEENDEKLIFYSNGHGGEQGYEVSAKDAWKEAVSQACDMAEAFQKAGYHKQLVNRLIEPFMWQKGVVTATRTAFYAFFKLRSHHAAQPEIQALSNAMKKVLEESKPNKLEVGEWHMPYVKTYKELGVDKGEQTYVQNREEGKLKLTSALKISTSCCAQISYRRLDDSLATSERVYNRLNLQAFTDGNDNGDGLPSDPPHASPCEHQAMVIDQEDECDYTVSGNFGEVGYFQHRKMLERNITRYINKE